MLQVDDADKKGSKYDREYNDYNSRGGDPAQFKKSQFQSNLPPRFQKQIIDRHDKPSAPTSASSASSAYPSSAKNVPFTQQFDPRYIYQQQQSQYKQQQAPQRRNMSLSQSSSDDNRRDSRDANSGSYRRRQESEDDDTRLAKPKSGVATIARSMSDSSQRSDDKQSDHNRSDKSTSREYLSGGVCWAEVCDNDKQSTDTKRRVSECSQQSDDQPKHILQRHKPLDLTKKVDEQLESVADKKTVLESPPPKSWADCVDQSDNQKKDKDVKEVKESVDKKSLESIPEKQITQVEKIVITSGNKSDSKLSKEDDRKRSSGSRFDATRDARPASGAPRSERGGYSTFPQRGNRDSRDARDTRDGNWNRRGGNSAGTYRTGRYGNQEYYSDSDYSEDEGDDGYGRRNGSKSGRKDSARGSRSGYYSGNQGLKEGFSPRGEPSRRGRGAAAGAAFGGRTQSTAAPVKGYGPASAKSPFGSNDEKSEKKDGKETQSDEDRTKLSQKALADGLINKVQKESTAQKIAGDKLPHSTDTKDDRVSHIIHFTIPKALS